MERKMFETNLQSRERQLHNEILSIQDEIEILLYLLETREKELIDVQEQLTEAQLRENVAA